MAFTELVRQGLVLVAGWRVSNFTHLTLVEVSRQTVRPPGREEM